MKGLNVGLEGTHIGVVIFGNSAEVVLHFSAYELTTDYEMTIRDAIESIPKPSSGERTFINRGLRMANRWVMREVYGMRMDVKQVCTFCNILCLSVGLFACLPVSFSSPPPLLPPVSLSPRIPTFSTCICVLICVFSRHCYLLQMVGRRRYLILWNRQLYRFPKQ